MMDCPKCDSESLVETASLGNIPLDVCPACGGVWLDAHELTLVEKLLGVVGGKTEIHVSRPALVPDTEAKPSGRTSLLKYSLGAVSLAGGILSINKLED